jgi:putative oxidoreductase
LVAIPLLITMLVAIMTVHWEQGWLAIAGSGSPAAIANPKELFHNP